MKKYLITSICIVIILCIIGASYSLWNLSISQNSENIIESSCFDITFKEVENTNISLTNTFPLQDSEGSKLTPYIFNVKNNCESYAKYELILEVSNTSTLDSKNLKVKINDNSPFLLDAFQNKEPKSNNIKNAYILYTGYLDNLETKEFSLRLWLDESVTKETEGVQNSKWSGKINIIASYADKINNTLLTDYIRELNEKSSVNLKSDGTLENNIRYIGKNPNNYITFGDTYSEDIYDLYNEENDVLLGENFKSLEECLKYKNDNKISSNEIMVETSQMECKKIKTKGDQILWRIIGLMNNIDDGKNKMESRVKIIRDDSIGRYSWDSTEEDINGGYGVNEWTTSSIKEVLNNYFYNELTDQNCYNYYKKQTTSCSFKNYMPPITKSMIDEVVWHTGSNDNNYQISDQMLNQTTMELFNNFYAFERSTNTGKICDQNNDYRCSDEFERTITWTGKIGLMYPSDFLFADTSNYEEAESLGEKYEIENWLYLKNNTQWTMTPMAHPANSSLPYTIFGNVLGGWDVSNSLDQAENAVIRPVAYLKTNTIILSGNGEKNNPYQLGL